MKVILGPLPCRDCGSQVTIVRRDVEQPCSDCGDPGCSFYHAPITEEWHGPHTHTLPDVGPFTPVDADGERHLCARVA